VLNDRLCFDFNKELQETLQIYTANDFKKELFTKPSFGINTVLGFEFKLFLLKDVTKEAYQMP
jgi:hypothetical protein